jgi:hypothetical protein
MVQETFREKLRLLAWSMLEFKTTSLENEPTYTRMDSVFNILLWVQYSDTTMKDAWAIMLLSGLRGQWKIKYTFPVRQFDHPPGNDEVYGFLRKKTGTVQEQEGEVPKFFRPDLYPRPEFTGVYGMDVRDHTWKHAIGEDPTIFFINGK